MRLQILKRQLHQACHPGDSSATGPVASTTCRKTQASHNRLKARSKCRVKSSHCEVFYRLGSFGTLATGPDYGTESVICGELCTMKAKRSLVVFLRQSRSPQSIRRSHCEPSSNPSVVLPAQLSTPIDLSLQAAFRRPLLLRRRFRSASPVRNIAALLTSCCWGSKQAMPCPS